VILNVYYDNTLIEEAKVDKYFVNQIVETYIGRNTLNVLSRN
jgi:hypothetical protein